MIRWMLVMIGAVPAFALARAGPASQPPPPADHAVTETLRQRLEALNPADPRAYFELGEEVADSADDPATIALARRLFVLALHLDRARGGQRIAPSACFALARLATREQDERWLKSLARTMDQRLAGPAWVQRAELISSGQAAYNAATALGLVRSGDGVRARQALGDAAAHALLHSYERLLSPAGDPGGLRALEREAERWPCPECHNQRIVRKLGSTGREPQYKLCPNCGGHPGPNLPIPDLVAHLRFESQLLSGIQRSWSAQVAADRGAPLRDPDPDDVPSAFEIDPAKTVFRDGDWVDPTGGANKPATLPAKPGKDAAAPAPTVGS